MNAWKFAKLQKKYTQNLTRCKIFRSESDACLKSWFKIWRVVKKLIRNLTRRENLIRNLTGRKNFNSKSDKAKEFYFKIMLFTKTFSFKIILLKKKFSSKSRFLRKVFFQNHAFSKKIVSSKLCSFKLHVKREICAFPGVKWLRTWFFVCKIFFKVSFWKIFFLQNRAF